jgi:hypothetical protein
MVFFRPFKYIKTKITLRIFVLLGYYAAYSGNSLPTFRDDPSAPSSRFRKSALLTLEDGTDRLSRNVGKELPLHAV